MFLHMKVPIHTYTFYVHMCKLLKGNLIRTNSIFNKIINLILINVDFHLKLFSQLIL